MAYEKIVNFKSKCFHIKDEFTAVYEILKTALNYQFTLKHIDNICMSDLTLCPSLQSRKIQLATFKKMNELNNVIINIL